MPRSLEVVARLIIIKLITVLLNEYAKLAMPNAETLYTGEKGSGLLLV